MIFIFSSCTEKNLLTDFQSEIMVSAHINMDKINSVLTKIIHIERSFAISEWTAFKETAQSLLFPASSEWFFSYLQLSTFP